MPCKIWALKQGEFKVLKGRGVDIDGGPKGKWILKVKTEFETHKAGSGKT
jgi:hypothetical protein